MNIRGTSTTCAVVLLLAVVSCSDNDNPTGGGGTPDTAPPAIVGVNPVDAFHVDVTFSEPVTKPSAEFWGNYSLGNIFSIAAVFLHDDEKTVTLVSTKSMAGQDYTLTVSGVSDVHGNAIRTAAVESFTGSDTPDTTPPEVISVSPSPGAVDTPVGAPVIIRLSDVVQGEIGSPGFTWLSGGRQIGANFRFEGLEFNFRHGGNVIVLMPINPLAPNSLQTIMVAGLNDYAGNTIAATEWSFTTTGVVDHTKPTLVSTTPLNNATNVSLNTKLSFTFSEPMNESMDLSISLTPVPGYPHYFFPWAAGRTWSNGGRTVTFELYAPLNDNEQYTVTVQPYNVLDLALNPLFGLHTVTFTTGSQFHGGSISGTITGDPGSEADDPTGALVLAIDSSEWSGDRFRGSATVAVDGTYTLGHLRDDDYVVLAMLDSNDDGTLDVAWGDAVGAWGVWSEPYAGAFADLPSTEIEGRVHVTNHDFPLFDPSALLGHVTYSGTGSTSTWDIKVGLFDTAGFSLTDTPVMVQQLYSLDYPWSFNSFAGLPDGRYYVGAFMDLNHDGVYSATLEPGGFHGGISSPTPLDVADGADYLKYVIPMVDPGPGMMAVSVRWPVSKRNEKFERLCRALQEATGSLPTALQHSAGEESPGTRPDKRH